MRTCFAVAVIASSLAGCATVSLGGLGGSAPPPAPVAEAAPLPPPKPVVVVPGPLKQLSEDDRQVAFDAALSAVADGKRRPWKGAKGIYGFVEPGAEEKRDEGTCRKYSETVYIGGRPKSAAGVGCRQPDGQWHIVS